MAEQSSDLKSNENKWLGILAAFGVVWYILLALQYGLSLSTSPTEMTDTGMSAEQVAYVKATPFWAHSAKSIAVLAGLFGALALFMRKIAAYWLLALSLIGTMGVMLDAVLRDGFQTLGGASTGFSIIAIVIALFLFWFAHNAKSNDLI